MRKLSLLAAAAMVAGGSAFAMDGGGVSISGEANFGVKFKENDGGANAPNELQFHHEFDIKFSASGTTDGGIGFGGSMSIDNRESVSLATKPGSLASATVRLGAGFADDGSATAPAAFAAYTGEDAIEAFVFTSNTAGTAVVSVNDDGEITGIAFGTGTTAPVADAKGEFALTMTAVEATAERAIVVIDGKPVVIALEGGKNNWVYEGDATAANRAEGSNAIYKIAPGMGPANVAAGDPTLRLDPDASHKVDNHGEVYISMDMHKLTIGSDLDRADQLAGGLADPGFDGIGIDDVAESVWADTARDVRYDGDFGVAKVAISYGDNKGDADWAAGFSFNVDPVRFGAGFDSNNVMSIGMGFEQGLIKINALYSTDSDWHEADNEARDPAAGEENTDPIYIKRSNAPDLKEQAMGVDVHYQMSEATSLVLVAAQRKVESAQVYYNVGTGTASDDLATAGTPAVNTAQRWVKSSTTVDAFGVGFSHDLGGGATLKAGAGSVDSNAVADLGITMKF